MLSTRLLIMRTPTYTHTGLCVHGSICTRAGLGENSQAQPARASISPMQKLDAS